MRRGRLPLMQRSAFGGGWGTAEDIIEKFVFAMVSFFRNWVGGLPQSLSICYISDLALLGVPGARRNVEDRVLQGR